MWIFGRKGASGFSGRSTAEKVARGIDGSALTAIVTGASSGLGAEATRVLASRGVHVIMAVRNVDRGKTVKQTIMEKIPDATKIDVMELDLASFASVRKFASEYKSLALPLNILINNAGVIGPFKLSEDGIELQFATNHLGHFLLTNLLLDDMKKTCRDSQREGRIVNVSSKGHQLVHREGIRFDKINDSSGYISIFAYGQSKLANILHANELARRFKEEGVEITANSLHPGTLIATNILRHHGFFECLVNCVGRYFFRGIPEGAATTCYVALHPRVKGVSGKYFADSNISTPTLLASDAELAKKLWDFSLDLTKES